MHSARKRFSSQLNFDRAQLALRALRSLVSRQLSNRRTPLLIGCRQGRRTGGNPQLRAVGAPAQTMQAFPTGPSTGFDKVSTWNGTAVAPNCRRKWDMVWHAFSERRCDRRLHGALLVLG